MEPLDINIDSTTTVSEVTLLYFRDSESREVFRSFPAGDAPIPVVDDIVQLGDLTLSGENAELAQADELEVEEKSYQVTERAIQYFETDAEDLDLGLEDDSLVTVVHLYVEQRESPQADELD